MCRLLDVAFGQTPPSIFSTEISVILDQVIILLSLFVVLIDGNPVCEYVKVINWGKGDTQGLYEYLGNVNWETLLGTSEQEQS